MSKDPDMLEDLRILGDAVKEASLLMQEAPVGTSHTLGPDCAVCGWIDASNEWAEKYATLLEKHSKAH